MGFLLTATAFAALRNAKSTTYVLSPQVRLLRGLMEQHKPNCAHRSVPAQVDDWLAKLRELFEDLLIALKSAAQTSPYSLAPTL